MKRFLGMLLLTSVLSWTALSAAQDLPKGKPEQPPDQKKVEPPDAKGDAQKKADAEAKEQENKAKELVARIVKNMEQSGDRLGKKDPGEATRQIQGDIIKDLDALIEQNQKQQEQQQKQQQQSSSSSGNSGNPSQGGPQSNPSGSEPSQARSGGQGEQQGQARNQGKGGNEPQGQARNEDKDPKGEPGRQGQAKDTKDGQGMLLAKVKTGPGKGILAEEFRNIWGHLPEFRRLEMDAYSRENFMRKYKDLLEQYYRTISEQNNR